MRIEVFNSQTSILLSEVEAGEIFSFDATPTENTKFYMKITKDKEKSSLFKYIDMATGVLFISSDDKEVYFPKDVFLNIEWQ